MGHDGDRRRRERRIRLERFIEETEEELTADEETGTFEDLIVDDTFLTETGTLTVTDEDLPIETGANPLPAPWQGIRRVGMVLNFSFVWDSEEEQWVRDEGNGGSSGTLANHFRANVDPDGTLGVPSGSFNVQTVPLDATFVPGFDPDDLIDESTNRWTAPADGIYWFSYVMGYTGWTLGEAFNFFLFEVGNTNHANIREVGDQDTPHVSASVLANLDAGDQIEVRTAHDSPNTERIENGPKVAHLSGFRIA